ncbi:MAG TPA: ester cyclase [Ktedonobacteraceae bacterium]
MNTSHVSSTAQDYEDLVRQFYVPFNTGDISIYDRILARDWIDDPLSPDQQQGPAGFKAKVSEFWQTIPGYHVTNDEILIVGNKAAVHSTVRSNLRGAKPAERPFEMRTCDFHRIEDGKIVYTWHLEDFYGLCQYLGAIPGR